MCLGMNPKLGVAVGAPHAAPTTEGAPWPPLSRESAMTTTQQRRSSSSVPQGKRASASCSAWPEGGLGRG